MWSPKMREEVKDLLSKAERCRRLAAATTRGEVVAELLAMAKEYEAKAGWLKSAELKPPK